MGLTQTEADYLTQQAKLFVSDTPIFVGHHSFRSERELISTDRRERFFLDMRHDSLRLRKYTYQTRARTIVTLVRLDVGDTLQHTNPDGVLVSGSHIHLYREDYDVKFAFTLADYPFSTPDDMLTTMVEFATFCRILNIPPVSGSFA